MNTTNRPPWLRSAASTVRLLLGVLFALSAVYQFASPGLMAHGLAELPWLELLSPPLRSTLAGLILGVEVYVAITLFCSLGTAKRSRLDLGRAAKWIAIGAAVLGFLMTSMVGATESESTPLSEGSPAGRITTAAVASPTQLEASPSLAPHLAIPSSPSVRTASEEPSMRALSFVDEAGRPLAQVEVKDLATLIRAELNPVDLTFDQPVAPLAESDATGRALLPGHLPQQTLALFCAGFEPQLIDLTEDRADQTIALTRAEGVRLTCQDAGGRALAGARVMIEAGGWGWPLPRARWRYFDLGTTDAFGIIDLPRSQARELSLLVLHPTTSPWRLTIPIGQSSPRVESIPLASTISGQVVGHERRPDLFVLAVPEDSSNLCPTLVEVSDSGHFSAPDLAQAAAWQLTPCVGQAPTMRPMGPTQTLLAPNDFAELRLDEGRQVHVLAVDQATGESLPPRLLAALIPEEVLADESTPHEIAPEDGSWTWWSVAEPSAMTPTVWVSSPGYAASPLPWTSPGTGEPLDLGRVELQRLDSTRIRVLESRSELPVQDAWVYIFPDFSPSEEPWMASKETDAEGHVMLALPALLKGRVSIRKPGWVPLDGPFTSGPAGQEVLFHIERSAVLNVTCRTQLGQPIPFAPIAWRIVPDGEWSTKFTSREGTRQLEVPPGGVEIRHAPEVLRGRSAGAQVEISTARAAGGEPPLFIGNLHAAEQRAVELVIATVPTLEVRVLLNGSATGQLKVLGLSSGLIDPTNADLWSTLETPRGITNDEGVAKLRGLATGRVTLIIATPSGAGMWTRSIDLTTGSSPVVLDLESHPVTVQVRDRSGAPLAGVAIRARPAPFEGARLPRVLSRSALGLPQFETTETRGAVRISDARGEAVFERTSAETELIVECATPSNRPTIAGQVLPPSPGPIDIELAEASTGAIEVHVVDGTGSPRPGIPIRIVVLSPTANGAPRVEISDSQGRLHLFGLAPGDWRLESPALEAPTTVALAAGEQRQVDVHVQ